MLHQLPRTMPTVIPRSRVAIISQAHIFCTGANILFCNTVISCKSMIQQISSVMRESVHLLRELPKHFWKINSCDSMHTLMGFTTFAYSTLASVHENTMTSFDRNSSFWVCNNSATGHICNNRSLFTGDLVPSIYIVGAAGTNIDGYGPTLNYG
jgi:hypothetical protein